MIMPASLKMATLFPDAAILPNRPADPFKEVLMEEKVSDCRKRRQHKTLDTDMRWERQRGETYGIIYDILGSRIVVNIHGDPPQGRDLGREFREARVVLALALVGVRHVVLQSLRERS